MTFLPGRAPKLAPKIIRTPDERATMQLGEIFDEVYGPSDRRRAEMLRVEKNREDLRKDRNFTNRVDK